MSPEAGTPRLPSNGRHRPRYGAEHRRARADPADGDRAEDRVWREREKIRELYRQGAIFFLCGDGQYMAPAVRETLAKIYQEIAGCSDEEASTWLLEMEHKGRYVPDVFA